LAAEQVAEAGMSGKYGTLLLIISLTATLLNVAIFFGQLSAPASARAAGAKLLDDEEFTDGLTKLIRKTVRDYCTVGKRESLDC
jgi:hypothetical protein